MDKALLDTDILSEVLKGRNPRVIATASEYLRHYGYFTISVITVMEIVKGLQKMQRIDRLGQFVRSLSQMEIIPFGDNEAILAGQVYGELERQGQTIGRADPMIAATAIHHRLVLVTGNVQHYERIVRSGFPLIVQNWKEDSPAA